MKPLIWYTSKVAAMMAAGAFVWSAGLSAAQTAPAAPPHTHPAAAAQTPAASDQDLQRQIAELRAQVAKLQSALDQSKQVPQPPIAGASSTPSPAMGGGMKGEMGAMPPGGMDAGEMAGMKPGGMGGGQKPAMSSSAPMMNMGKGEMGMPPDGMKMPDNMMNMMKSEMGMGSMSPSAPTAGGMAMSDGAAPPARAPRSMSSLPGVPGASHVYHIGSTGFFLDQLQLNLTTEQQAALNRIKERALLDRNNAERRIEQGEQELWALTGADLPDAAKVQAKLQEIEQLRTAQRIAFIRAVGEATKQLTPEQQNALTGMAMPKK